MRPDTVIVKGIIRNSQGNLLEGAIIDVQLNKQDARAGFKAVNVEVRTFSNSFGRWAIPLLPTDEDTFYTFRVQADDTIEYKKLLTVAEGVTEIQLQDLEDYTPPDPYAGL